LGSCTTELAILFEIAPDGGRGLFFSPFRAYFLALSLILFFWAVMSLAPDASPSSSFSNDDDGTSFTGIPGPAADIVEAVLTSRM